MDKFIGKWQVASSENIENQLQILDWPEEKKKMFKDMKLVTQYEQDGDDWIFQVSKPDGIVVGTNRFKLGQNFDSKSFDGRPLVSRIEFVDGKFAETHTDAADPSRNSQITREVVGDELVLSVTIRGGTSVVRCKRV